MNHTYPPLVVLYIASVVQQRIGTPDYAESTQFIRKYKGDCSEIDCSTCIFMESDLSCTTHVGLRGFKQARYAPSAIRLHVLRILKEKP